MGNILQFYNKENTSMENSEFKNISNVDLDFRQAQSIRSKIRDEKKVNDPTRRRLAKNLGELLHPYGRKINKDDLMEKATGTTYLKASERLSKFQIIPGTNPSVSKIKFLTKTLHDYVKITDAAASLVNESRDSFLVKLFKGTKYINEDGEDSKPDSPSDLIADVLNRKADYLIRKYDLQHYFNECDKYSASPSAESGSAFEVNHDWYNNNWSGGERLHISSPMLRLFSIIRSKAPSRYTDIREGAIKEKRTVASVEVISLAIMPSGNSNTPKLVFYTYPNLVLMPDESHKFPKSMNVVPKEHGKIQYHGMSRFLTDHLEIDLENDHFCEIDVENELDLKWMENYSELLSEAELNAAKGKHAIYFPHKILPVNSSTIRQFIDVEKDNILEEVEDSLQPIYDTSRAISEPNSMLAQLEINLFYDGFQSTFDQSEKGMNIDMYEDFKFHEMSEDFCDEEGHIQGLNDPAVTLGVLGDAFKGVKVDSHGNFKYPDILVHLEDKLYSHTRGFEQWRRPIEKEIRKRAEEKLKDIVDDINKIDKEKQNIKKDI
jgi:hypothetical protein